MNKLARKIAMPTLSEKASDFYQRELNRLYGLHQGRHGACPLQRVATDFERLNASLPDNYIVLKRLLDALFEELEATAAVVYLLPNITLHAAIDRLDLPSKVHAKIVHPLRFGISALEASGTTRITLVGTRHTMQSDQLAEYFEEKQIEVDFPRTADILALDGLRLEVFARGYSQRLKIAMEKLLARYENTVLACTELSVLNTDASFTDLARLQMAAAISALD
ncbi:aspartate/glutamate racemase family protein [Marinimicrobium alkaliphilum]|uniref:aspartate/glutamate racemase family protein n=1 Tax=Marinimicrobium alkaliphilum TaxID=2202654 RepID=UPI000DB9AEAE|nr:aspartate/glutamate racemase family protein [Marinimicrobium alkaliphilum]